MTSQQMIEFLQQTQKEHGVVKIESITGFHLRMKPKNSTMVVVPIVGDGLSVRDLILIVKPMVTAIATIAAAGKLDKL